MSTASVMPPTRPGPVVIRTRIGPEPLSTDGHGALVRTERCGAVVCFTGVVRSHDDGRDVRLLEYVAHPTAEETLADIAGSLPLPPHTSDDIRIAVSHRLGELVVGDVAMVCAVAAPHRRDAFVYCGELVDRVKELLPIWKRQVFTDGTDEWVDCP